MIRNVENDLSRGSVEMRCLLSLLLFCSNEMNLKNVGLLLQVNNISVSWNVP